MPPETEYNLQDLADLADVTPRTVRFYITQGLLASPGKVGPGTAYTDGHLNRLRLIKRLQREHLPLAEIRARLAFLDDTTVAALVGASPADPAFGSAIDYIRGILGGPEAPSQPLRSLPARMSSLESPAEFPASPALGIAPAPCLPASRLAETSPTYAATATPDRSQWDRVLLAPDVELHVRRPLGRRQNKRVERLIEIAREILEEDQP